MAKAPGLARLSLDLIRRKLVFCQSAVGNQCVLAEFPISTAANGFMDMQISIVANVRITDARGGARGLGERASMRKP
jgi:hypothetical protein